MNIGVKVLCSTSSTYPCSMSAVGVVFSNDDFLSVSVILAILLVIIFYDLFSSPVFSQRRDANACVCSSHYVTETGMVVDRKMLP